MNQPIKQPSTFMKQSIAKTQKRSRLSWSPRSGEKSALTQAADSRLGETATMAPGEFRELSLRRGCLAWARQFVAQNTAPRLGKRSSRKKLGEFLLFSLGRDELAWASISVLTTEPRVFNQGLTHNNTQSIFVP